MATQTNTTLARVERTVERMVAGQQMAAAEPSATDLDIARRQAAGDLTAEEAVAEAITAARASSRLS